MFSMSKQVYAKHASPKHGSTIFMQLHLEYLPVVAECFCNVFPVFCFSKSHSVVSPTFQINNLRYHITRHSASPAVTVFGVFLAEVKKENLISSLISGLKTVHFVDFVQKWWKFCHPRRLDFRRVSPVCPGIQKVVVTRNWERRFFISHVCCAVLGPVVRRPISANQGLNFNLGLFFLSSKAFSPTIFSILFRVADHQIVDKKN